MSNREFYVKDAGIQETRVLISDTLKLVAPSAGRVSMFKATRPA